MSFFQIYVSSPWAIGETKGNTRKFAGHSPSTRSAYSENRILISHHFGILVHCSGEANEY